MQSNEKERIGKLIRERRAAKGMTQQELADASGVSLRSVQRIEGGEVLPRPYTLRVLGEKLGLAEGWAGGVPLSSGNVVARGVRGGLNKPRKWILTIGVGLLLLLGTAAFVAQSPRFPETDFERFLLWGGLAGVYTVVSYRVWK